MKTPLATQLGLATLLSQSANGLSDITSLTRITTEVDGPPEAAARGRWILTTTLLAKWVGRKTLTLWLVFFKVNLHLNYRTLWPLWGTFWDMPNSRLTDTQKDCRLPFTMHTGQGKRAPKVLLLFSEKFCYCKNKGWVPQRTKTFCNFTWNNNFFSAVYRLLIKKKNNF